MCGIAGAYNGSREEVELMVQRLLHRGPDGSGVKEANRAVHGHTRLALLDTSNASSQPFTIGGSTLTYNGELWNHRKLREVLSGEGFEFKTTGDTEVLAAMLNRYGLSCLNSLDGMFAFAWSDEKGGHWLVRDSFGKVPVYVAKTRKGFVWASERKAFPSRARPCAVPPGYYLNLVTGEWTRWYALPDPKEAMTPKRVIDLLRLGVRKRLDADVPVCCLVSGGLDSSLILALAKQESSSVVAYIAVFDELSKDLWAARNLCKHLGIEIREVSVEVTKENICKAIQSIEIPSKAQIEIATLCLPLAQRIYSDGYRACLSGEAADEIFGGYGNFCIAASRASDKEVINLRIASLKKMSRGNFVRCNKAFMSAGVECRLPFMEQALVEGSVRLGKSQSPPGKKLLKEAARGVIPDWIVDRQKETFQGGSGVSLAIAKKISNPRRYYSAELRKSLGYVPGE